MTVQHILNAIPYGLLLLDEQLNVMALNPRLQALTGYSLDEAKGVSADFILRSSISAGRKLATKVLMTGSRICERGTILNRRRQQIAIAFTISRVDDCGKGKPGVLLLLEETSVVEDMDENAAFSSILVGNSPQMQEVFERMAILARTDASVLITGETGCGKDRIAEELHRASSRAKCPFIKVNCGALPEALLESELFGHNKGAFTGAIKDHPGMFRLADRGTLFLTEIGDLCLPLQVKLLSVLDDRSFYPVGSSSRVDVDVRVVAATHRDLREEVRKGRFREDLFYRLNVLHLHIPSLRQRQGDVRLLLEHFLRKTIGNVSNAVERFDADALRVLLCYSWPGNIRELRNVVEYAVHMCRGEVIGCENLPEYLLGSEEKQKQESQQNSLSVFSPDIKTWSEIERQTIIQALQQTGGQRQKAAEILGYGRTTLWRKMKTYNLK